MKAKIKNLFLVSVLLLCNAENVVASEEATDFVRKYVKFYKEPINRESTSTQSSETLHIQRMSNVAFMTEIENEVTQSTSASHKGILYFIKARTLLEREILDEAVQQTSPSLNPTKQPTPPIVSFEARKFFEKAKKLFEKEIKFGENDEFQRDKLTSPRAYLLFYALTLRSLESLTKKVPQKLTYLTQLFDAVNELSKTTITESYFDGINSDTIRTMFLELGYGRRENFQNLSFNLQVTHILFTISLKKDIFEDPESVTATLLKWITLLDPLLGQRLMAR